MTSVMSLCGYVASWVMLVPGFETEEECVETNAFFFLVQLYRFIPFESNRVHCQTMCKIWWRCPLNCQTETHFPAVPLPLLHILCLFKKPLTIKGLNKSLLPLCASSICSLWTHHPPPPPLLSRCASLCPVGLPANDRHRCTCWLRRARAEDARDLSSADSSTLQGRVCWKERFQGVPVLVHASRRLL